MDLAPLPAGLFLGTSTGGRVQVAKGRTYGNLESIHDSEINYAIHVFYDGCVTAKLGDDLNGYQWEETFSDVRSAIAALAEEARTLYPESEFAKRDDLATVR